MYIYANWFNCIQGSFIIPQMKTRICSKRLFGEWLSVTATVSRKDLLWSLWVKKLWCWATVLWKGSSRLSNFGFHFTKLLCRTPPEQNPEKIQPSSLGFLFKSFVVMLPKTKRVVFCKILPGCDGGGGVDIVDTALTKGELKGSNKTVFFEVEPLKKQNPTAWKHWAASAGSEDKQGPCGLTNLGYQCRAQVLL